MKPLFAVVLTLSILFMGIGSAFAGVTIYMAFENIDNGKIADLSGNGIDGAVNGDVSLTAGVFGKAAKFAAGSFLDLDGASISKDLIPSAGFSILAWVNVTGSGEHAIFNSRASDGTWLIHPEVRPGGGVYRFTLRDYGMTKICDIKAGKPVEGEWHHFAGTYGNGKAVLYIDGQAVGETDSSLNVAADWDMGARVGYNIDNGRPFTGLMDDLSIWDEGLSQDQVNQIMNDGMAATAVDPKDKLATRWASIKR